MSLYNMVHGVQPAAYFVWPFIGDGHHPDTLPRFRDVFLSHPHLPDYEAGFIVLTTRTASLSYAEANAMLLALPGFVRQDTARMDRTTELPRFDSTFAHFTYRVPEDFLIDYTRFRSAGPHAYSVAAQLRCRAVYPKLRTAFDRLWPETIPTE